MVKDKLQSSKEELNSLKAYGESFGSYKVEDFFRNPEKTNFQISPNGTTVAFLSPHKRRMNIYIQGIQSYDSKRVTSLLDRDVAGYAWLNNNTIVYVRDNGGDENYSLFSTDIESNETKELTPFKDVKIQIIDDLEDFPNELILAMNKDNKQLFDPYRLNIVTGELTKLATNTHEMPISSWFTDHNGKLRLAIAVEDGVNSSLLYRENENEEFKKVLTTDFRTSVSPIFFDFEEPHIIYVATNQNRDKSVITRLDCRTGEEVGDIVFEHDEVDVESLSYSRKRKKLTSISYFTDKLHRVILDDKIREIYNDLSDLFKGWETRIVSQNKDEDKFIIRTFSDRSMGAYYLYDNTEQTIKELARIGYWLEDDRLHPMKPIQYKSRDGMTIHGYLTMPEEVDSDIPLIVLPHGGPWVRDYWGFNSEVQLLAHHEFAVLQVNYRGSTGYGKKFWEASFKEWGRRMQDDITDGVNWICENYPIDIDRIAIYGGSYGGYAALAGVAYTPDLYKCCVDYVGVSNLLTFLNTIPPYWKPYLKMMYEMVGNPAEDEEMMRKYSPALNADLIEVPVLVAQGANDPRVNIEESNQIVRSLIDRNIPVTYIVKEDEGHGFMKEENRIEFYKIMLGFLHKHLNI